MVAASKGFRTPKHRKVWLRRGGPPLSCRRPGSPAGAGRLQSFANARNHALPSRMQRSPSKHSGRSACGGACGGRCRSSSQEELKGGVRKVQVVHDLSLSRATVCVPLRGWQTLSAQGTARVTAERLQCPEQIQKSHWRFRFVVAP